MPFDTELFTAGPLREPKQMLAEQEIKMIEGPLFVGHPYALEREVVALSESRRTESHWIRTRIFDGETDDLVAEMLLNHATLKESYAGYRNGGEE